MFKTINSMKITKYVTKHHRWIVSIVVALFLVPIISLMLPKIWDSNTQQYYYLPLVEYSPVSGVEFETVKCWPSRESERGDALRCNIEEEDISASRIDPCFYSSVGREIVECPNDPFGSASYYKVRERVWDEDIEKTIAPSISEVPWYIILENGEGCSYFIGGASAFIDGRMDYGCASTTLSLPIDKSSNPWTIRCTNEKENRVETCRILEAWF